MYTLSDMITLFNFSFNAEKMLLFKHPASVVYRFHTFDEHILCMTAKRMYAASLFIMDFFTSLNQS